MKGNISADGNIDKEVKTDGRAPDTQISTSTKEMADMLLTDEEKQQVEVGTDIMIVLDVKDASGSVSSEDKTLVEAALNDDIRIKGIMVGQYLDISLYKLVGETRTDIIETPRKITIRIVIPDSLKNSDSKKTRNFAVIRVHDGEMKLLADLDNNADTITIETDRFSTYVIVYKDTEAGGSDNSDNSNADNGNNSDNNNTGSGNSSSNNSTKPDLSKDDEPMTGENMYFEKYATLAVIVGFIWILLYFAARKRA